MMEQLARVYNEKDRRTLEWLRQEVGDAAITVAAEHCGGSGKPYLSVICQYLGVRAPAFRISIATRRVPIAEQSLAPIVASSPRRQDRRLRRSTSCIDVANNLQSIRLNPLRTLEAT
jgi:hypothetical protein